jgi:hypothetical protein
MIDTVSGWTLASLASLVGTRKHKCEQVRNHPVQSGSAKHIFRLPHFETRVHNRGEKSASVTDA